MKRHAALQSKERRSSNTASVARRADASNSFLERPDPSGSPRIAPLQRMAELAANAGGEGSSDAAGAANTLAPGEETAHNHQPQDVTAGSRDVARPSSRRRGKAKKKREGSRSLSESDSHAEFKESALAGLELTFKNDDTKKFVTNSGFPKEHAQKEDAKKWWDGLKKRWKDQVTGIGTLDKEVKKGPENKDFGNGIGATTTQDVSFKDSSDKMIFWYRLSLDPGVLEIQTHPVTHNMISKNIDYIGDIVDSIFTIARELRFVPATTTGGGHVNIDFETGFDSDYSIVPHVILATDEMAKEARESDTRALIDYGNETKDPFLSTNRLKMNEGTKAQWDTSQDKGKSSDKSRSWKDSVGKAKLQKGDARAFENFKSSHAQWLWLHPTGAQFDDAKNPSSSSTAAFSERGNEAGLALALHHQAVNIAHLSDKHEPGETDPKRIEFRFFDAQKNKKDVLNSLQLVSQIIQKAKALRKEK